MTYIILSFFVHDKHMFFKVLFFDAYRTGSFSSMLFVSIIFICINIMYIYIHVHVKSNDQKQTIWSIDIIEVTKRSLRH